MSQQLDINAGSKIRFAGEKQAYTVQAKSDRFAICTKPFNVKRTVLYTIIDFQEQVRGRHNLIWNIYDFTSAADINQCLSDLIAGKIGISSRNQVPLEITK